MKLIVRLVVVMTALAVAMVGLQSPAIAWTPASHRVVPVEVADVDDTPTTPEAVDALDNVGAKVLDSAHVKVNSNVAVSQAQGIEVTVPRDPSAPVELGSVSGSESLQIGIPASSENANSIVRDGVSFYTNTADETVTAVNPRADGGAQFLVAIGGADSPTRYEFPVAAPDGAALQLTEDGGAEVVFADGSLAASIPAPWAVDANQQPVPTHFEIVGGALVQVVEHTSMAAAYPVVADPDVFSCDWNTSVCVKFNRSETRSLAFFGTPLVVAGGAIALRLCTMIPAGAVSFGCTAVVAPVGVLLVNSFRGAANDGKCVEVHFSYAGLGIRWKTESC